jgi:hypothetical protein
MKSKSFTLTLVFLCLLFASKTPAQIEIYGKITGKVTDAIDFGIKNVGVMSLNLTTLEANFRSTNDFGNFQFENLLVGHLYLISINSNRYLFPFRYQLVSLDTTERYVVFNLGYSY